MTGITSKRSSSKAVALQGEMSVRLKKNKGKGETREMWLAYYSRIQFCKNFSLGLQLLILADSLACSPVRLCILRNRLEAVCEKKHGISTVE